MNSTIAGAIIAGGKSSRFGEPDKAEAMLGNKALIEHAYGRLSSQVSEVFLNHYRGNLLPDLEKVADAIPSQKGPLNGVLSSLKLAHSKGYQWLLISPCDTPFLPLNLAERLHLCAEDNEASLVMPSFASRTHPSLSLWNVGLIEALENAVIEQHAEGFRQFYSEVPYELADWSESDYHSGFDPFFNINYPEDLILASEILEHHF